MLADDLYVFNHPDAAGTILRATGSALVKAPPSALRPTLFPQGLMASDGEPWRKKRRVALPAFHREALLGYERAMVDCTTLHSSRWPSGATLHVHEAMQHLALDIVVRALLGSRLEGEERAVLAAVDTLMKIVERPFNFPLWVPTPSNVRLRLAMRGVDRLLLRVVRERRRSGQPRHDLLGMILAAADSDGGDDARVRDELGVFLIGGHETTASALTWICWLLARHPAVDERLAKELRHVLGDARARAEELPRLPYLDAVIKEALRLYPPIWLVTRRVALPCSIGGFTFEPGANVFFSQYVLHRDPRWFARPNDFLPERWADGLAERLPRDSYLPFGGGPAYCIGQSFAQQEIALVLATLLLRVRFVATSSAELRPNPTMTLRPTGGAPLRVEERECGEESY